MPSTDGWFVPVRDIKVLLGVGIASVPKSAECSACALGHVPSTVVNSCVSRPQLTNSAVSATTSSYTSQCVHDFVPPDADLVLVEFSVNDWEVADAAAAWMNNSQRCALASHKPQALSSVRQTCHVHFSRCHACF